MRLTASDKPMAGPGAWGSWGCLPQRAGGLGRDREWFVVGEGILHYTYLQHNVLQFYKRRICACPPDRSSDPNLTFPTQIVARRVRWRRTGSLTFPRGVPRCSQRARKTSAGATSAGRRAANAPAREEGRCAGEGPPLHPGPRRRQCRRAGVTCLFPFRLWPAGRGLLLARRVEPCAATPSSPLLARAPKEFADAG